MIQKSCKIILLGEASVGKTSIISRYIKKEFSEKQEPTIGAAFSSKELRLENGSNYLLNIWDTAGTEVFRSINKLFYRDASIAVLLYDITKKETFEEIKNYWTNEVKTEAGKKISNIFFI